ncbi:neural cell adhesion molecule 2-like isoform X3 [Montipora foliosa]|uniref:neural cell adhesion molecule 2-like isoform X3 n=1 Tax=Montipora foliosa TaxID=591990 RepID=UPI0035F1E24C
MMKGFFFLLLLCVDPIADATEFDSPYNGKAVTGFVGSSMQFNWSFTGDVTKVRWGLSRADNPSVLDIYQILFSLKKTGPEKITTPVAYAGRVTGNLSNGLVIFTVHKLKTDDAGYYCCEIKPPPPYDTKYDHVQLLVEAPPYITSISDNQTVNEGNDLTLHCDASGNPAPNTTWTRLLDNRVVTMPLTNITRQHEGGYRCTANNGIGKVASKDVFITVHYPAYIEKVSPPSPHESWIAQNVTFVCKANGVPTPTIIWKGPNGAEIKRVVGSENVLRLLMQKDGDFGSYLCEADNTVGSVDKDTVQVDQIRAPDAPAITTQDEDIQVESLWVKWTPPIVNGGSNITGYRVIVLQDGKVIINKTTTSDKLQYFVDNSLTKSTNYTLRVSALNKVFEGKADEKNVMTKYQGAPATAEIIDLLAVSKSKEVTIKWNEPQNNGASITRYTVYRRDVKKGDIKGEWIKIREIKDVSRRQVVVSLEKNKVYEFVVTARNRFGESLREGRNIRKLNVSGDIPEPVNIQVEGKDDTVILSWEEPENNGATIIKYSIYTRIVGDEEWKKVADLKVKDAFKLEYVVSLERGKNYELMVTATNAFGESAKNEDNIQTFEVPNLATADPNAQTGPTGVTPAIIAGAAAVGVLLILGLIILVIWRKRRKTPSETGSATAGLQGPYPDELADGYSAVGAAQQLQEGGLVADVTYAQVDKSKKKKKTKTPVTDVYAQVDKSKNSNKKRNRQPGELEYAELDDFRPNTQPPPQASGATARPLVRAPVYEGTEYADITQFGVPQSEPTYDNVPRKKDVVYSNVESM